MTNTAYAALGTVSAAVPTIPLSDAFGGSSLDAAKWAVMSYGGGAGTISEGSGVLSVSITSGNAYGVQSNTAYDLTDSSAFVAVESGAGDFLFELLVTMQDPSVGSSTLYKLDIHAETSGLIYFGYVNGSAGYTAVSATYNATAHKYWRIRESGGIVYWETSSDALVWTVQYSAADPFPVTSLYVTLWDQLGPRTSTVANFNTPPATGPGAVSVSAVILSPSDVVVSELSAQAFFNYGDNAHDIRDAVEAAIRAKAGDPDLHVEFVS